MREMRRPTGSNTWLAPRVPWRAFLAVCAAALLAAALPLTALAAEKPVSKSFNFDYFKDRRAWYWDKQQDVEIGLPVGIPTLPPPIPPIPEPNRRQRLPNPQRPDTLPVAVYQGEHERMSAIYFNLTERGVTTGSEIQKLTFSIQESADRNEWPSVNADAAVIQACQITEFWGGADEAQVWKERPGFGESGCVEGKRDTKTDPPTWTFDLTRLSQDWGEDPFAGNYGVMLLAVLPQDAGPSTSWQVNLKVPSRDVEPARVPPGQEDVDDYEQTKNRVVVDLKFIPGEEPVLDTDPIDTDPVATTTTPTSSFTPATDFTSGTPTTAPSPAPPPAETTPPPVAAPVATTGPQTPGYVWALLPAGLLALAAVRSVVLEPSGGTRPDGAIAAIRRRNAERRGGPLRDIRDPISAAWGGIRRGVSGTGAWVAKTARRLRRR